MSGTSGNDAATRARAGDARPVRVLMTAPSLDMLGGQSRQSAWLRERLSEASSVEVAFLPVNPRLPRGLRWMRSIKYVRTVVTTLLYWAKLLTAARRCDVMHVYSASYYSYLLSAVPALIAGKLYGKRTILNYHSGEAEDHLRNWRTAVPTVRLADVLVVPSDYLVDVFARFGLKARAIHNFIELDRFRYRERTRPHPVFLTSRLLEPLYNVGCVLRAFALIQERYTEAGLTVAGEGWQRAELEEAARALGLRNTRFVGAVPFERMPELYDSADIYLTATDLDNMPGSIIECLAAGLPVVTTDAGGIPYIVAHEETCLMIRRNDHEAMADAAFRLLEEPGLASAISQRGREHCRKFDWQAARDAWVELYKEMAGQPAPARGENHEEGRAADTRRALNAE